VAIITIVSIGLRLHEFEWTENFIQSNCDRVHHDFRQLALSFNLSSLYYEKKEYQKALKESTKFNNELKSITDPGFEDTYYNLDSRSLLLKIYFELEDEEPLNAIIDSFKLFLKRNKKVSERQRNSYLNLIKYTKKLNSYRDKYRLLTRKNPKALLSLKNEINSETNIINQAWLQAQVENLEKEMGV